MDKLITICLMNISKNIKRKLTNQEISSLIDTLQNCNISNSNLSQLSNILSKKYKNNKESIEDKSVPIPTSTSVSTSESKSDIPIITDTEVNIVDVFSNPNLYKIQKIFSPSSSYSKDYIVLDTINCSEILSNGSRFRWGYSPTQNIQSGIVNSYSHIKNIVSMKIYQPNFPPLPVQSTYNSIALISMLIEEFSAQAFIASGSRKYHYLMRLAANTSFVPASSVEAQIEDYGDGIFNFKKPITTFDTITISFGTPIEPLFFPSDDNRIMFAIEFTYLKNI